VQLINAAVLPLLRQQRYNMHNPKSKFFDLLISHLESFPDLRMCIQPFIYGHFGAFFIREKNEIGI
jgi:hypothetical protein